MNSLQPKLLFLGFAPLTVFIYINALKIFTNLYPHEIERDSRKLYSDGYQLLTIPFKKVELLESELRAFFEVIKASKLVEQEEYDAAKIIYQQTLEQKEENFLVKINIGHIELLKGNIDESRKLFSEVLSKIIEEFNDDKKYEDMKHLLFNNIAWTNVIVHDENLLSQADKYSEQAVNFSNNNTLYNGTRGAVLVRKGEHEEGIKLLKESYDIQTENIAKSSEALFIAIGEAKLGNQKDSLKWLETARSYHSKHYFFQIAETEILENIKPLNEKL